MADVQRRHKKVIETPVKKKSPKKDSSQTDKKTYCILCRKFYFKHEAQDHMHSMLHHRELETVLGKDAFHDCQACKEKSLGLSEYSRHILTAQHKERLKSLMTKNTKPPALCKTLSTETISSILSRNKALKKEERKAMKKKKKKQKQQAGQKRVEQQQGAIKKKTVASKGITPAKSKQMQARTSKQKQQTQSERSNYVVVQNKENNALRPQHYRNFTQQNQSGRPVYQPGGRAGQPEHHQYVYPYQFPQSAPQHMRYDVRYPGTNMYSTYNYQAAYMAAQVPYPYYYSSQYHNAAARNFTSDQLPQDGVLASDFHQGVNTSQPESSNCSAQPDSADKSVSAAPIRDVDVSAMLKQIRRTLGVREPCRADREARKQNSEAGIRAADRSTSQQAEVELPAGSTPENHDTSTPAVPAPQVRSAAPSAQADVCPSVKPKATTSKKTQEISKNSEKSSVAVERQTNSRKRESQLSSKGSTSLAGKTTSSEPKLSKAHKVRIAHKTRTTQGKKEAVSKTNLDKLYRLSGARSKLSWKEMCDGIKKKDISRAPRFGIELGNRQPDHESSAPNSELPLSEGFHWESIPKSPSGSQSTLTPPPHDGHTETQRDSQTPTSLEEPDAAQAPCSSETEARVSVKVEPSLEDESGDLRANISASKRKHSVVTDDGLSDKSTSKKKKTKSSKGQDQMDQLLTVSLREDELSRSLQDLDKSLVQARNALQAAYTEVQRILLLRQQFTAEVNTLRAKRIEILQGMQEGYAGASNGAGRATTSSSGPTYTAPSLPSSSAFSTSSSQQPCATTSSVTTPHPTPLPLPVVSLKQEICHSATTGQASLFSKSSNSDALQVPLNQPAPLFSPDLLPQLLLGPSHLAAPTAAASAKQPTAESSASVNTTSPDLSARQQEQETREGLIGSVKSEMLVKKAQSAEGSSVEETAGNLSKGQVKGKEPAADKSVPERGKKASDVGDKGNESDDSVEMVSVSDMVVIDIYESESEDSPETNSPAQPETPQRSVSVEFSAAGTQTAQQSETERKFQPPALPAKDACTPAGSVEEEEPSLGAFSSHTGPVHGLQVHDGVLYTCSGDNTARAYSLVSRECRAVFEGHTNKVNCLLVSSLPNMPVRLYTGSSDQTIRCYSIKSKKCLEQISLPDRVLCLHIAWNILYAGLASGAVVSYDLKTLKELDVFECHGPRGVSCLGTAQEGARRLLLVGSYDSTISVRDAKSGLLLRSLEGHTKTVLCMKVVNDLVFSGSSDTSVHAHNIHTGELVRIYKGHGHAVTSIVILGKVMVTACLDELVRVYELQSHDRLQVYGGHSDMVMCMAVHKSVIYTGCYDGSVQAVKLNLMKNHRCWWQSCSLIFGMPEHLLQHLVADHNSPNLQTVKCRWRGCNTFFATQQSVRQDLPEHMQSHVDSDSKLQP
ncbi:zinc finger protein 106 [Leuresthes tenuis]|uniref:zinc finger protein 106 n=1 Tax=Leuresthes tenuis TaxID=355514 RepID=UPI003B514841